MDRYWPIFRGKQFELLALRDLSESLSGASVNPVIEPVKKRLGGLQRCLQSLKDAAVPASVVINPEVGEFSDTPLGLLQELEKGGDEAESVRCVLAAADSLVLNLSANLRCEDIDSVVVKLGEIYEEDSKPSLHILARGFAEPVAVKAILDKNGFKVGPGLNILLEDLSSRRHYKTIFEAAQFVWIADGFKKRKNADYLAYPTELYATALWDYSEFGYEGFGDYSIVGSDYSESGGPAWAVAIHLTSNSNAMVPEMYVHHFVSDDNDSPSFPAEKYAQALEKLKVEVTNPNTTIVRTGAVGEFLRLHENGHYPGLGYVKKLSMMHHLELMMGLVNE